jgi:hypothetical protein
MLPLLVRLAKEVLRERRQRGLIEVGGDVHVLERRAELVADLLVHLSRHCVADQRHRAFSGCMGFRYRVEREIFAEVGAVAQAEHGNRVTG